MTIQRRDKLRRRKDRRERAFSARGERNRPRPVDLERRRAIREPDDGEDSVIPDLEDDPEEDEKDLDLEALDEFRLSPPLDETDRPLKLGELIPYRVGGERRAGLVPHVSGKGWGEDE
jgi:hypothetical protein